MASTRSVPNTYRYSESLLENRVPIVIDNGSYQCRAGWAASEEPLMIFKNLIAKPRKEKGKKDTDPSTIPSIQIGNDITNIEAVRFQLKTQFDRNIVTHFETQEQTFDYIFNNLGINTEGCVRHPIVITEPFVNLNFSRQLMSELLFECYRVPSVAYGIDGLLSFHNNCASDSGLIINCGYHTTHIIPILKGKTIFTHSRRINLGGYQIITYLHKLLQLKYPAHLNAITFSRAEELLLDHCFIALHYQEEIKKWSNSDYYNANVRKIQLPYIQPIINPGLSVEVQKERKKEMSKRLIEINARRREEKLAENEEQLNQFLGLLDMLDDGDNDEFYRTIQSFGIKDEEDLMSHINKLNSRIEKIKQKISSSAVNENNSSHSICDEKSNNAFSKIQPPSDISEFNFWIQDLKKKRADMMESKLSRKQKRLDMVKRRTVAAQERMKLISQLARKEKENDDFGMRDEDWEIYKTISKDGNNTDSDVENEKLLEIEEILREYDPQHVNINNELSAIGVSEAHQLHLAVERMRAPELLFQPFMMGNIEAGVAETLEYVLKQFNDKDQLELANNVFVTGGCAHFPGLEERLSRELLEMRPFQSSYKIYTAKNPSLDAWHGARKLALDSDILKYSITRQEYDEIGSEYLKEHYASNKYYKTPIVFTYPSNENISDRNLLKEDFVDIFK